ncbi:MAG: hypothetical protein ACFFDN_08865 [Candidatus Hodarchaeota archaeon]
MGKKSWLKYLLISSIIGIIAETGAFIMHWWNLNPWWFFIPCKIFNFIEDFLTKTFKDKVLISTI